MVVELLKAYDDYKKIIGVKTRKKVHNIGYWHDVFNCWFITKENNINYIYLQIRSESKNDYPNMLDVTVAGHLLYDEEVSDGIREIKEEIGIDLLFNDLISLGTLDYCIRRENFIDKEIAHIFLYKVDNLFNYVTLEDEVSGIVKIELNSFEELWMNKIELIRIEGFKINEEGNKILIDENVTRDNFLPYGNEYYTGIISRIFEYI